jgi:uncharacterized membrane protein
VAKKCLDNPRTRFLAILLYCTNPQVLYYDQMARVYSIVMMVVMVLYSVLLSIADKTDTNWDYVKLALITILGLYTFNLFPFVSFAVLLFALVVSDNTRRVKILAAYFFAGLAYLPLFFNLTIRQFNIVQ